jgi:hypothetical protein
MRGNNNNITTCSLTCSHREMMLLKKLIISCIVFVVCCKYDLVHAFGTLTILPFLSSRDKNTFRRNHPCNSNTQASSSTTSSSTCLHAILSSSRRMYRGRVGLKVPLLVLTDEENPEAIRPIPFPMPANHLPITEITTLNLYGIELTSASHYRLIQAATASPEKLFGYIVWKNPSVRASFCVVDSLKKIFFWDLVLLLNALFLSFSCSWPSLNK